MNVLFSSFVASQLLVYENKAAFEKRNAATEDEKVEPLEEDSFINGLGASKKEAHIVIVPSFAENTLGNIGTFGSRSTSLATTYILHY